jgi:flagellar motility protein MotE (MotC chaperone)
MLIKETLNQRLDYLVEAGVITTPERNLRSKIDSILRSIENLTEKQKRITFEIKKQKTSLLKKRQELQRSTKSRSTKVKKFLESSDDSSSTVLQDYQELQRLDSKALQESDQVLNQF